MPQTKGWAVSHGPGPRVGQHRGAPIPQGVQLFAAGSQLQWLGERSLCPSSCRVPALPLGPGGHSCSTSGAAAGGKTQQMHRPGKSESPPAPQGVPRRHGELSRLASYCAMHQGRGGCTSPSGNSSSCCPSPAPAREVFPALSRGQCCSTMAQEAVTWAVPGAKWLMGHRAAETEPDATSGPMIQADVPIKSHNLGISGQCWSPSLRAPEGQEQSSQAATQQQHLDGTEPLPSATNSCKISQLAALNSSSSRHPHKAF